MDEIRLRTAVGDASRSCASVAKTAAAHPDELAGTVADYRALYSTVLADATVPRLREIAREHVIIAVAFMDAARQKEAGQDGAL